MQRQVQRVACVGGDREHRIRRCLVDRTVGGDRHAAVIVKAGSALSGRAPRHVGPVLLARAVVNDAGLARSALGAVAGVGRLQAKALRTLQHCIGFAGDGRPHIDLATGWHRRLAGAAVERPVAAVARKLDRRKPRKVCLRIAHGCRALQRQVQRVACVGGDREHRVGRAFVDRRCGCDADGSVVVLGDIAGVV